MLFVAKSQTKTAFHRTPTRSCTRCRVQFNLSRLHHRDVADIIVILVFKCPGRVVADGPSFLSCLDTRLCTTSYITILFSLFLVNLNIARSLIYYQRNIFNSKRAFVASRRRIPPNHNTVLHSTPCSKSITNKAKISNVPVIFL